MREWKPGDVALLGMGLGGSVPVVALRTGAGDWVDYDRCTIKDSEPHWIRPLVVLDLEQINQTPGSMAHNLRLCAKARNQVSPHGTAVANSARQLADQIEQQTKPPKPEVFSHLAARQDNTHRALCGKVWEPSEYVTVVGKCPECADLAESGWIA